MGYRILLLSAIFLTGGFDTAIADTITVRCIFPPPSGQHLWEIDRTKVIEDGRENRWIQDIIITDKSISFDEPLLDEWYFYFIDRETGEVNWSINTKNDNSVGALLESTKGNCSKPEATKQKF